MKMSDMVDYKINDAFIRPARVTRVNEDGTADLLVMIHHEDFPEFSLGECLAGHAHRLAVKEGTAPGECTAIPRTSAAIDPRVDALIGEVAQLSKNLSALIIQVQAASPKTTPAS